MMSLLTKPRLRQLAHRLENTVLSLGRQLRPLALFNLAVPRRTYQQQAAVSYGPAPRQQLDIYLPLAAGRERPVVLFFYGGSWQSGRRQDYRFVGQALSARGLVTVIPDYRLYPEVRFPDFIADGAAALAWVKAHIDALGGNPAQLFVMGHSAGAYIAAMLALDAKYLGQVGLVPQELGGFIGLAGPYDFLPLHQRQLIDIFGGRDGIPETQPINFVTAAAPAALLLHGATDRIVAPENTRKLAARWRQAGRPVQEIIYPHYKHLTILLYLASFLQEGEPVIRDVTAFIAASGQGAQESAGRPRPAPVPPEKASPAY